MSLKGFITKILSLPKEKKLIKAQKEENLKRYQQAMAVVMVDIALVDNDFSYAEHGFILSKLSDKFGLDKDRRYALIQEAEAIVHESKDIDSYGKVLRDLISCDERESIIHTLDQLSYIDNERSTYETKLRQRYERLLAVRVAEAM